jgi:hypothetical protein
MDIVASPVLTIVLNLVATSLVSKGILDASQKEATIQLLNNVIAALMTVLVGGYSIYKMVDLHKHKLTIASQSATGSTSVTMTGPNSPVVPPVETAPVSQTGLPQA